MFGLVRVAAQANIMLNEIETRAKEMILLHGNAKDRRLQQEMLFYHDVEILAKLTPKDKKHWVIEQVQKRQKAISTPGAADYLNRAGEMLYHLFELCP